MITDGVSGSTGPTKPFKKKVVVTVLGFLFLSASLGIGVLLTQKAQRTEVGAAGANLLLTTNSSNPRVQDTFVAAVTMNTQQLSVTGIDLKINYDQNLLTANSITPGPFLPYVFIGGTISNGVASIVLGCPIDNQGPHPVNGTGLVAQINFTAKAPGSTNITFNSATKVSSIGATTNQVETMTPVSITIINPTPTPTRSPSPTPTRSPSPTPTRSPSPTPTRSPSPTPTRTPSPSPSQIPTASPSPSSVPTASPTPTPFYTAGDVNRDGFVNVVDIGIIIDNYDIVPMSDPRADVNEDGIANIIDIGIVIDNYTL